MKSILENIINDIPYDDLGLWKSPPGNTSYFSEVRKSDLSEGRKLFEYQKKAIENITKVLYLYYKNNGGKQILFRKYKEYGLDTQSFAVNKFVTKHKKQNNLINKRFTFFCESFFRL